MADTLTLYKLIVLKMLDEADAPLTRSPDYRFYSGKRVYQLFHTSAGTLRNVRDRPCHCCIHQKQLPLSDHRFRQTYPEIFR